MTSVENDANHLCCFDKWDPATRRFTCQCGATWTETAMEEQASATTAALRYRISELEKELEELKGTSAADTPEPPPVPNANPAVWDLVMEDIRKRDEFGKRKYNTRLQPFNGRDALSDAYQEALDLTVYLRQALYERHFC